MFAIILWVKIDISHTIYFAVLHISTSQRCEKLLLDPLNIACVRMYL